MSDTKGPDVGDWEVTRLTPVPTVGRIVHYVTAATIPVHRAAIVTEVQIGAGEEKVALCVFDPVGGFLWEEMVPHDENAAPGTWHWPERAT